MTQRSAAETNASRGGVILVTNAVDSGGIERNVRMVATHLSPEYPREIWALLPPRANTVLPCSLTILRRWTRFDPGLIYRVSRQLRQHPARIIHFFHFASGLHVLLANLWLPRAVRKKMVFSFGSARTTSRLINWYVGLVARSADAVTGNSPSVVQQLIAQGIPETRIEVLLNGHELEPYARAESRAAVRARLGLPAERWLLLTTGRLTASKRHLDLLQALAHRPPARPWQLLVVGDGELRESLQAEAAALGIDSNVTFLGFRDQVIDYLRAADLFVFPSESEGLPNSLIEASLAALPIVACRVDGVRDVVEDGVTGWLVPPREPRALAEGIRQVDEQPREAARRAAAAREWAVDRFSVAAMIERVQRIYQRVLAADRPGTER